MATRWSRAHSELYLSRKHDDGVVADVEELTVVLWLKRIRQRRSVEWVWLGDCHGVPIAVLVEEGNGSE